MKTRAHDRRPSSRPVAPRTASILLSLTGLALAAPAIAQVQWRTAPDVARRPAQDAQAIGAQLAALAQNPQRAVVRLRGTITDAARLELARAGVRLAAYVGDNSFFASLGGPGFDPVAAAGLIDDARPIDPQWKAHPDLLAGRPTPWAIVPADSAGTGSFAARGNEDVLAVYAVLHEDAAADAAFFDAVDAAGGRVWGIVERVATVHLPRSGALTLSRADMVQWVEPAMPALQELNAENRTLTQAEVAQASPYNLSGAGISVFVFDGGTVTTSHVDILGRVSILDSQAVSGHASHVAGTVAGDGSASSGAERGMAPAATILSAGFGASGSGWLYTNPGDIIPDYTAALANGADLSNNSIGTNVASNGFDCAWHGDYGEVAGIIDSLVRGNLVETGNTPFRVVWAAGNERGNGRCGTQFRTTAPPSGNKNALSIAAVNANDDSMTSFSSWGPTDDGRLKPDIAAPGCQSGGDGGVVSISSSNNTGYSSLCGTSMASPTVAGLVALILEDWRQQFPASADPRNSTLKALLAHTAQDRGNVGPDYQFGYGSVRVRAAIDQLRTRNLREASVSGGSSVAYELTVPAGAPELRLTLAWDDFRGTGNVVPALINDLDLVVTGPGGVRHWVWTLDPANPSSAATRTTEDRLNNIEQVLLTSPPAGTYTVTIRGTTVPQGPQPFSIVASHALSGGSATPTVSVIARQVVEDLVPPGEPRLVAADVIVDADTLVPGSVQLLYRPQGTGAFSSIAMTNVSGNRWEALLPGMSCGSTPEYFISAAGATAGVSTAPSGGATFDFGVGSIEALRVEDAETDTGWSLALPSDTASAGRWTRMAPQGTFIGSLAIQPANDTTAAPGVNAFVTDGNAGTSAGSFDVDNGITTLTSPPIDLAGKPDALISYNRWYSNNGGGAPNTDTFPIQISGDGVTWLPVETVGPASQNAGGWISSSFRVGDRLGTPTNQVRLRFIAQDTGNGSLVEAAIDDLVVSQRVCVEPACPCPSDYDGSGSTIADLDDIVAFFRDFNEGDGTTTDGDPSADVDCTGEGSVPDVDDVVRFFEAFANGC